MKKRYVYPKGGTIFSIGIISVIPLIAFLAGFPSSKPKPLDLWVLIIATESLYFLFFALSVGTIYYILNIELLIDDHGIFYKSPLKRVAVAWNDISNVTRTKYLSGGAISNFLPKDLRIETRLNKTLKIIFFIKLSTDDSIEGIIDLENEIKGHGIEIQTDTRYMTKKQIEELTKNKR